MERALSRASAVGKASSPALECLLSVSFAPSSAGFPDAAEEGSMETARLAEDMRARPPSLA
ncbi:MAG: hypothetical protein LBQ12_01345 [Deltaproteobacteria bacterium]|nr:hypothetical protein [Deltaproteobacteria bacterium]